MAKALSEPFELRKVSMRMPALIAADYHDDYGDHITATWLRADGIYPPDFALLQGAKAEHPFGDGSGRGLSLTGYGSGHGHWSGSGYGAGLGLGSVGVYGRGVAPGRGEGSGSGYGGYGSRGGRDEYVYEEILRPEIGQYVVVRSRDDGFKCGEYVRHEGREVVLLKARAVLYWSGDSMDAVSLYAVPSQCGLSHEAYGETLTLDACGIVLVSAETEKFLRSVHPHS